MGFPMVVSVSLRVNGARVWWIPRGIQQTPIYGVGPHLNMSRIWQTPSWSLSTFIQYYLTDLELHHRVYLTITGSDIPFVAHTVNQFVFAPTTIHWTAVLCIPLSNFSIPWHKEWSVHHPAHSPLLLLQILIGQGISMIVALLQDIAFSLEILSFPRKVRSNLLSLALLPKPNILLLLPLLLKSFGFVIFFINWASTFYNPLSFTVTARVLAILPFKKKKGLLDVLPTMIFFMNAPNTLRLIVILFANTFFYTPWMAC